MSYLWRVPHAIDGGKLARTLPDFRPTPLATALAEALAGIGGEPALALGQAA
jgi:hypothetical protein